MYDIVAWRRRQIDVTVDTARGRKARQVAVPPAARAQCTLPRVDYEDAFLVETGAARNWTAEQWARAILEGAPDSTQRSLRRGWRALGLRLGSLRGGRRVLGWEIRRNSPDFVLLGARSWLGLEGEVFCERLEDAVLTGTFGKLKNPLARVVWARIAARHRRVLRWLVDQAMRREGITT
jgi:hypothetical protein